MIEFVPAKVINLSEPGFPMNGSIFIASKTWPLEYKMSNSKFPAAAIADTDIGWFNPGRDLVQGIIAKSNSTERALATSEANTTGNYCSGQLSMTLFPVRATPQVRRCPVLTLPPIRRYFGADLTGKSKAVTHFWAAGSSGGERPKIDIALALSRLPDGTDEGICEFCAPGKEAIRSGAPRFSALKSAD
jgi:hypothetical protein